MMRKYIRLTALIFSLFYCLIATATTLTGVDCKVLSNQTVQVNLQFSNPVAVPKSFTTEKPPEVILDFFDVDKNNLGARQVVNRAYLASITTVSANGRTRLILKLQQTATYEVHVQGNQVFITLTVNAPPPALNNTVSVVNVKPQPSYNSYAAHYIKRVDFKRNASGGGDVILDLSDADTVVNVNQQSNIITLDLNNTRAPGTLQRKLDVTDFATPVQTISTETSGNHTQILIQATGQFEQLAYQVNKQFVVSVNPLSNEKKALEQVQPIYTGKPIS
ncbi:MAG: AMIN domain-containing protein, partial [Gammaproteobacteria bacterium]|nr:AMIN domain-containing protein [Gammaproteobacteria bacterium]